MNLASGDESQKVQAGRKLLGRKRRDFCLHKFVSFDIVLKIKDVNQSALIDERRNFEIFQKHLNVALSRVGVG